MAGGRAYRVLGQVLRGAVHSRQELSTRKVQVQWSTLSEEKGLRGGPKPLGDAGGTQQLTAGAWGARS